MLSDARGQSCVGVVKNSYISSCAKKPNQTSLENFVQTLGMFMLQEKKEKSKIAWKPFSTVSHRLSCDSQPASGIHWTDMDVEEVVFLHFLPIELTILWFTQNKTQRQIQKISTLYNAEAPKNLGTYEYPGLPNIPVILHEAIWLLPPFPFQNTIFLPEHLQSPDLQHCLEWRALWKCQ